MFSKDNRLLIPVPPTSASIDGALPLKAARSEILESSDICGPASL